MLKTFIQGFLIGMAKMIPGFSGSLLAIIFGVYGKTLDIIAHLKNIDKSKLCYLLLLGSGIVLGIIIFSYLVNFLLKTLYFPIMLLFIGLIFGSVSKLVSSVKGYKHYLKAAIIFILSFLTVILLTTNKITVSFQEHIFLYFPLGLIEALTTLVPGISGTAIYMIFGVYDEILNLYINVFNFNNFLNLTIYFSGFVLGVITLAKILTFILKKYQTILYICILGFMFGAIFLLIKNVLLTPFNIFDLLLCLFFLIIGYFISMELNQLF